MTEDFKAEFERAVKAFEAEIGPGVAMLLTAADMRPRGGHSTATNMPLGTQIAFLESALVNLRKFQTANN